LLCAFGNHKILGIPRKFHYSDIKGEGFMHKLEVQTTLNRGCSYE
jgi:hypothetical protein